MKDDCWEWVVQKSNEVKFFLEIDEPIEGDNDHQRQEDIKVIHWQGL